MVSAAEASIPPLLPTPIQLVPPAPTIIPQNKDTHIHDKRSPSDEPPPPSSSKYVPAGRQNARRQTPKVMMMQAGGAVSNGDIVTVASSAGSPPLAISEPAPFTPTPAPFGGQPTHPSSHGGFPPQKVNKCVHPEVPSGILSQPLSPPPSPPPPPFKVVRGRRAPPPQG